MINDLVISRLVLPSFSGTAGRLAPQKVERACQGLLFLAVSLYVILFLSLTLRLYDRFATNSYDLAIFDQAAWLISRGHSPFVTVRGLPLLADHFSLILYLLAPLYWLWPSAKLLLAVQTLALALGALPLYALTRQRLGSAPWALLLASAYLLYPALEWSGTYEFHPETLATPLLLAAFLFLERRQWRPYFLCLVLALMTKETVGLTVLALGVYALRMDRRIAFGTLAAGALGMAGALLTIRAFNHGAPSAFFALYGPDGAGPGSLLGLAFSHPLVFWDRLATVANGVYLFQLLYPLAFLPLLAPEVLLLALPALLLNVLSTRGVMHTVQHQYTAALTPLLLLAGLVGAERAQRWGNRWTPLLLVGVLGVGIVSAQDQGPMFTWRQWVQTGLSAGVSQETQGLLAQIPAQASVSASAALLPHLSHRRLVYAFPNPFQTVAAGSGARALRQMEYRDYSPESWAALQSALSASRVEYVVLAPPTSTFPVPPRQYPRFLTAMFSSPSYGIVSLGQKALVLRRGADHAAGLRLLAARSEIAIPSRGAGERAALTKAVQGWLTGTSCGCSLHSPAL